jgi:hypothetical protein
MLEHCERAQQSLNVFLWIKAGKEKQSLAAFESGEITKQNLALAWLILLDPKRDDDAAQRYSDCCRFVALCFTRKMRGR